MNELIKKALNAHKKGNFEEWFEELPIEDKQELVSFAEDMNQIIGDIIDKMSAIISEIVGELKTTWQQEK